MRREQSRLPANLIVVCQVFYPDEQSTSQLLSAVWRELSNRGHKSVVLAGFPGLPNCGRVPGSEEWHGIDIKRGGIRWAFKRNMASRILSYISYSIFACYNLMRAPKGSRVLIITNPPFNPALLSIVCRFRGHSFVVMLQDIFPDGLAAVRRIRSGGLFTFAWRMLNRSAFRSAYEIWVLGRDMAKLVEQKYGVDRNFIRIVPHWASVEPQRVIAAEETALFKRLGLHEKIVVQYSGNMGLWHDIECVVRAAAILKEDKRIHFLMIGGGMRKAPAETLAEQLGLCNITWLPYQPNTALSDALGCCHVALVSQRDETVGIAVPCKIYGILASARAVIAQVPALSEVALIVQEEECGLVVPPGDEVSLATAIRGLASDPAKRERMGERSLACYRAKYTVTKGADRIACALFEWSGRRAPL